MCRQLCFHQIQRVLPTSGRACCKYDDAILTSYACKTRYRWFVVTSAWTIKQKSILSVPGLGHDSEQGHVATLVVIGVLPEARAGGTDSRKRNRAVGSPGRSRSRVRVRPLAAALMKMMARDAIKGQCRPALPLLSNQFKSSQDVPLTEGMFSALFTATVTATVTRDFKFRRVGRA